MPVPEAVKEGATKADDAIKALQQGVDPNQQQTQPTQQAQQTPNGSATPDQSQPQPQTPDIEQKFNTLQGKYNREVPKLLNENAELKRHNAELESRLNGDNGATPSNPSAQGPDPAAPQYSEADFEAYGPELKHLYQRNVQLEGQVRQLTSKIDSDEQTRVQDKKNTFFDLLGQAVPDWQQINHDKRFFAFLAEMDPTVGVRKHDLLNDAYSKHDSSRVIAIFQQFLGSPYAQPSPGQPSDTQDPNLNGQSVPGQTIPAPNFTGPGQPIPSAPAPPAQPGMIPVNPASPGTVPIGQQVTPQSVPGAPMVNGKIWTRAEISQHYEAVRRGDYHGREADAKAIEADIFAAQTQGRIAAY
jgi:hypothetical protein